VRTKVRVKRNVWFRSHGFQHPLAPPAKNGPFWLSTLAFRSRDPLGNHDEILPARGQKCKGRGLTTGLRICNSMAMYRVEVVQDAEDELAKIRVFDRNLILSEIKKQLTREPATPTRRRKRLDSLTPSFEAVPPVWELRVSDWRVFYDVDEADRIVWVRAVRPKPPDKRTEDIV